MKLDKKGFSFMEMLIALTISGIVLVSLSLLVSQSVRSYRVNTIKSKCQTNLDNAFSLIEDEILNACIIQIFMSEDKVSLSTYDKSNISIGAVCYFDSNELRLIYDGDESYISGNITECSFKINKDCIILTSNLDGSYAVENLIDNIMIDVTLCIEIDGYSRSLTKTFVTRNACNELSIGQINKDGTISYINLGQGINISSDLIDIYINE